MSEWGTNPCTLTYAVSHPQLSEPVLIDAEIVRSHRFLAAMVSMHVLQTFDEMLPIDEFTVELVKVPT